MVEIPIKPLTVNKAWQGRRFKTKEYKQYEADVLRLLPKSVEIPEGEIELYLEWGFSNYGQSDWDNPIKPFQDCLQKKYGFNDNKVRRATVEKVRVEKGCEYIKFSVTAANNQQVQGQVPGIGE